MNMFRSEVIRFIIVGLINTAHYYIWYIFLIYLMHLNYLISHIFSFIISMIGSFFLNSYYTYKTKPTLKKFFAFPLTYIVNITVTTSSVFILVELLDLNEIISPFLASIIAIPFTFVVSKKVLTSKT